MKNITGIRPPEKSLIQNLIQILMKQTPAQIFFRFLKFGFLAFGGPVAQIAMIKKELVEDEKWVSKEQFNRALAVYQVLPGPEAHELCVYFGMKAGGRLGGFLAGLAFMLPGFAFILLLTWAYVQFGIKSPVVQVIFHGIQTAVVALICFATYRIGKHAVINYRLACIAIAVAVASWAGVHFLLVLLLAGAAYASWQKSNWWQVAVIAIVFVAATSFTVYRNGGIGQLAPFKTNNTQPTTTEIISKETNHTGSGSGINKEQQLTQVFITGLKGGLLTFGGAYTAIPFIREDAVIKNHWMTQEQFLDGIALSGILPAPLIIFSTFVGYFGGGWPGAILITIAIFLPAFCFTLIGHTAMEKLIANTALHNFLDGITAGVVGLIAITALQLLASTINSIPALVILLASLLILIKYRSKYTAMFVILGAGLLNLIWNYLV
jgi:chromate transporter